MPKGVRGFQKGHKLSVRKGRPKSLTTVLKEQKQALRTEVKESAKDSALIAQRIATGMITNKIQPLIRAGLIPALGQHFVFRIDEEKNEKGVTTSRKHVQVTDPDEIARALDAIEDGGVDPDGVYFYITAKEPDHKAVEMLLNRALGKPKESIAIEGEVKFSLVGIHEQAKKIRDAKYKEIGSSAGDGTAGDASA